MPDIGDPTLESGRERVAVHGSLDLTRNKSGLDAVMHHFEGVHDLPDAMSAPEKPASVKNPFG